MADFEITKEYIKGNPCYKANTKRNKNCYMQHSTGTPGAKAKTLIAQWNKSSSNVAVEFIIDDTGVYQCLPIGIRSWHCAGTGNNTHIGCEICEPENARMLDANWLALSKNSKNNTAYAVRMLQKELIAWGYDPKGVDGTFGPGCENAVKDFQKDHSLKSDGSVGLATLHELQKRAGSYLLYDAKANQKYFEDAYRKAVFTCAYVLNAVSQNIISKNTVCCHAEGYQMGIASNHADVLHWFTKHNKSMDNFRDDVETYLSSGKLPYEQKQMLVEKQSFDIAKDKGLFEGMSVDKATSVTFEQMSVILNRLNLLE